MKFGWIAAVLLASAAIPACAKDSDHPAQPSKPGPAKSAPSLNDFSLADGSGKEIPLSTYKGKIVLIVNVASKSMYSDQIAALNKLEEQYQGKGLAIIGVPSDDFGKGEPGTDADIQKHYRDDLHVTFPITAKCTLTGVHELPVYEFLTGGSVDGKPGEPVHWNYTKFLVGRDGVVLARFAPDIAPDDPEFEIAVQKALDGKLKPMEAKKAAPKAEADDEDDR